MSRCDSCIDDYLFPETTARVGSFPIPVKYCRNKSTGQLEPVDWQGESRIIDKIGEEYLEIALEFGAYLSSNTVEEKERHKKKSAIETADMITAGITALQLMGYDEEDRALLFKEVYEKNRARGYYG